MSPQNKRRIPSEEDFARARARDEERGRNLEVVRKSLLERLALLCRLHDVWVIPEGDREFRVLVFLEKEKDNEKCKSSGLDQTIIGIAFAEIERAGRGNRNEVKIAFEFDSDENVKAKYQGQYWYRLHSSDGRVMDG